ncbi:hypothetical protein Busp01_17240 [Trinickia caryophylli]|uniref:Uncharacterized protein n=1 Tax=Trinickia caryophylli TaxID=28094 RepID=A0A1X7HAE0_TRICW|nr:hypothetical protein Busp01_17240 [Trinickia caryophylli]SMF81945.1 hypothetical protein SAMN06295900_12436 [Trinickia caryophylli]
MIGAILLAPHPFTVAVRNQRTPVARLPAQPLEEITELIVECREVRVSADRFFGDGMASAAVETGGVSGELGKQNDGEAGVLDEFHAGGCSVQDRYRMIGLRPSSWWLDQKSVFSIAYEILPAGTPLRRRGLAEARLRLRTPPPFRLAVKRLLLKSWLMRWRVRVVPLGGIRHRRAGSLDARQRRFPTNWPSGGASAVRRNGSAPAPPSE